MALNKIIDYFKNNGMEFFNKFMSDNDFYNYLCVEKNYGIGWRNPDFSLRRIMYCNELNKKEKINEIHYFNKKCCKPDKNGDIFTDGFYLNEYLKRIKILEQHYNKK